MSLLWVAVRHQITPTLQIEDEPADEHGYQGTLHAYDDEGHAGHLDYESLGHYRNYAHPDEHSGHAIVWMESHRPRGSGVGTALLQALHDYYPGQHMTSEATPAGHGLINKWNQAHPDRQVYVDLPGGD